ncbi:hypothetical protein CBOM_05700 [Ceraceosorus bombacis]|uniref:Uncharacterized protein n=1 Tax=Ceraceosorus bombacis TaxID=401625 RepID=A0A0P1BRH5_9BASI|nr:hypothetical protein CBOM_05700 [Ceraceosorus bombacis]
MSPSGAARTLVWVGVVLVAGTQILLAAVQKVVQVPLPGSSPAAGCLIARTIAWMAWAPNAVILAFDTAVLILTLHTTLRGLHCFGLSPEGFEQYCEQLAPTTRTYFQSAVFYYLISILCLAAEVAWSILKPGPNPFAAVHIWLSLTIGPRALRSLKLQSSQASPIDRDHSQRNTIPPISGLVRLDLTSPRQSELIYQYPSEVYVSPKNTVLSGFGSVRPPPAFAGYVSPTKHHSSIWSRESARYPTEPPVQPAEPQAHLYWPPAHLAEPTVYRAEPSVYRVEPSIYLTEPSVYLSEPPAHPAEPIAPAVEERRPSSRLSSLRAAIQNFRISRSTLRDRPPRLPPIYNLRGDRPKWL